MTYVNIIDPDASAIKWVCAGAASNGDGHDSFVIVSILDNEVTFRTNNAHENRTAVYRGEDCSDGKFAVKAKALQGIVNLVEDGRSLSINFDEEDESISMSVGASSMKLPNLYPLVLDHSDFRPEKQHLGRMDALSVMNGLRDSASAALSNHMTISGSEEYFYISFGSEGLYRQEGYSAVDSSGSDDYVIEISTKPMSSLRTLSNVESIDLMDIYSIKGGILIEWKMSPLEDSEQKSDLISTTLISPGALQPVDNENPCEADYEDFFTVEKSLLYSTLRLLSAATADKDAKVYFNTTRNNCLYVSVKDKFCNTKTGIIDAKILRNTVSSAPLSKIMQAVKSTPSKSIVFGIGSSSEYVGWAYVAPVDDHEDEDEETLDIIHVVKSDVVTEEELKALNKNKKD